VPCGDLPVLLAAESCLLSAQVLEQLGLVFRFVESRASPRTSGNARTSPREASGEASQREAGEDHMTYLFPYFLADMPFDEGEDTSSDFYPGSQLIVTFQGYMSWAMYYGMLRRLSELPGTMVVMRGSRDCMVKQNELQLMLQWKKNADCDSIIVTASR
jgi:hypothetical protein